MGAGVYKQLPRLLNEIGANRIFIGTDKAVESTDFFSRVRGQLDQTDMEYVIFTDIEPDPSVKTVNAGYKLCQDHGAAAMIAIGGGSTIDVCKAVGILSTNGGKISDYAGNHKFSIPPLPLLAVPTTAGTGSEVSGSCVITDTDNGVKMSIRHLTLNPARFAILDPLALATLPAHVAAHSGLDAFVHAFESFVSRRATLLTDSINLQAISLIAGNIRQFYANRENTEAGLRMLCGSTLAGIGFTHTGTGNIHCISRHIGARFHLSHGLSNAIMLPHVARFNGVACPEKYRQVAAAMGENTWGLSANEAVDRAVAAITRMCGDLDIPGGLRQLGAAKEDLVEIVERSFKENYNAWNPRHTSRKDFEELITAAY
ncbi:iron-containing alcohol dehydrogenase [Alcaligenaceae bacterium]|nr:iron-containing alcohol dehydrogenase [Alcaligenaceae bacterium]